MHPRMGINPSFSALTDVVEPQPHVFLSEQDSFGRVSDAEDMEVFLCATHPKGMGFVELKKEPQEYPWRTWVSLWCVSEGFEEAQKEEIVRRVEACVYSGNPVLDLSSMRIASLPQTVTHINVSHNNITRLPASFAGMRHLHGLDVSHNRFETIPAYCNTWVFAVVDVAGNPLSTEEWIRVDALNNEALSLDGVPSVVYKGPFFFGSAG